MVIYMFLIYLLFSSFHFLEIYKVIGLGLVLPSGGKSPRKRVPANPRSHANFRKNVPEGFKSLFDTASLKISTRAFRIRIQISKRSIGRRVMVILLQEKNFGPNVIYCLFCIITTRPPMRNQAPLRIVGEEGV